MEENTVKISHILFMIFMMGIIIVVGTYAWLSYRSNDTAMVLTIGEINNVQVTLSPYQIKASLLPQVTYTSDNYTSVTAINNSNRYKNIRLYYKINNIDNELISSDFKYTIERSIDGTTYSEYKSGNFSSASNGAEITILEESIPNNTTYYYKVYLWIDGTNSGQSYMQGKSFNGELRAEIVENQYQFAEYLQSTGTQFIDSGVIIDDVNYEVDIVYQYISVTTNSLETIAGCAPQTGGATRFYPISPYTETNPRYVYGTYDFSRSNWLATSQHVLIFNNSNHQIIEDDTLIATADTSKLTPPNVSLGIFAIKYTSSWAYKSKAKLYSLQIKHNNELLRDFIPAYRKSDGIRGLYDCVNGTFYTNAGTGTFEIGPEI